MDCIMHQEQGQADVVSTSRPGILLIGNFLSATRGTRGVCEDLADDLKAAGWPVITTSSRPGRLARLIDFLSTVWRQRKRYKIAQVDVYSGLSFLWAEWVCWALRIAGKPYVLTLHGGNLPSFSKRYGKRIQCLLGSACAVTTPSDYLFAQMRAYRSDLVRLPNSLKLSKYPCRYRDHPEPNLVWLRAFHDIYNPSLAVKVVSLLIKDFASVRLFMVGPDKRDGSLESAKNLAIKLGILDRIMLTGAVPKSTTPQWLNRGDILLNTPRIDNTPVSILEAMACGLCIVSTNVGGIPYLLEDEGDALLVPTDDEAAMANAIRRFLADGGLAERLSKNARRKAEQCDWSAILPQWEQLFMDVAGRKTA